MDIFYVISSHLGAPFDTDGWAVCIVATRDWHGHRPPNQPHPSENITVKSRDFCSVGRRENIKNLNLFKAVSSEEPLPPPSQRMT